MLATDTGLLWIPCATRLPPLGPPWLESGGRPPRPLPPVADGHGPHREAEDSTLPGVLHHCLGGGGHPAAQSAVAFSRCRALPGQRQASTPGLSPKLWEARDPGPAHPEVGSAPLLSGLDSQVESGGRVQRRLGSGPGRSPQNTHLGPGERLLQQWCHPLVGQ